MAPPDWAVRLARAGRGLLFFDELSSAPPAVQAALLRVVLERRVGSLELPPGGADRGRRQPAGQRRRRLAASPPLANRFVHLQWTHDPAVVARGLGRDLARGRPSRGRPGAAAAAALARARGRVCGLPRRPARPGPPPARRRERAAAGRGRRRAAGRWRCGCSRSPTASRRRPGGAVRGADRRGRGRRRPGAAGLPGPSWTCRTRTGCWPTRTRSQLPERGDRQLAFLTAVVVGGAEQHDAASGGRPAGRC